MAGEAGTIAVASGSRSRSVSEALTMSRELLESDWKALRALHPIALERFCRRVLDEIQQAVADTDKSSHERLLDVFDLARRRRREMRDAFDDMRRSRAFERLVSIQFHRLLTDEEMERFSPQMRESVRSWFELTESDYPSDDPAEEDDSP
jgi:hypothetical protein